MKQAVFMRGTGIAGQSLFIGCTIARTLYTVVQGSNGKVYPHVSPNGRLSTARSWSMPVRSHPITLCPAALVQRLTGSMDIISYALRGLYRPKAGEKERGIHVS